MQKRFQQQLKLYNNEMFSLLTNGILGLSPPFTHKINQRLQKKRQ